MSAIKTVHVVFRKGIQGGTVMTNLHPMDGRNISSRVAHGSLAVFMCTALGGLLADPALASGQGSNADSCTRTAKAAVLACQHEVKDDFWIAIGNCNNLSDSTERALCVGDAKMTRGEGKTECGEQREARLEVCDALGEAPYDPQIDPALFVDPAQIGITVPPNPYFPLVRGQKRVYKEQNGSESITVTITAETREILGVKCAVVRDVVEDDGAVIEDTVDWFAQDIHGNVWYFGEISQDFEAGLLVSIEGTWTAGEDSAKPGIIMKAAPVIGETYRQEFSLGNAEDLAEVLKLNASAVVPAASCSGNCLVSRDFTPISPGANEHKYYMPGVGLILEEKPDTGARVELVEVVN